jgi:hypothetical protein
MPVATVTFINIPTDSLEPFEFVSGTNQTRYIRNVIINLPNKQCLLVCIICTESLKINHYWGL